MEEHDIQAMQAFLAWWVGKYPTLAEEVVGHLIGRPNGGYSIALPKAIYNADGARTTRTLAIAGVLGQNGSLSASNGAEKTGDSSDH